MYYKLCNARYKVSNKRYKLCNKKMSYRKGKNYREKGKIICLIVKNFSLKKIICPARNRIILAHKAETRFFS